MNDERWQKISGIFNGVLEREGAERDSYLRAACAGDEALRREVESLLEAHEREAQLIDGAALEVAAPLLAGSDEGLARGQRISYYKVIEQLGAGGMGEVYLAEDARLGRKVALKLLPSYLNRDADRLRRFRQEACAASSLNHPNIITVYEVGETEGRHFIATELIEGETLRERMRAGKIAASEALDIAVQVANALDAAHSAGIIHRDIKPENIMVRRDGYVKVLDFGLAKPTERRALKSDGDAATQMLIRTNPGVVMGTINYMSPEQARALEVDDRTDIWSLGVVVYEMVAGRAPFDGATTSEVAAAILGQDEPPPLARFTSDVTPELERIVRKALSKDREERYQTARDLLIDLKNLKQELEFETKLRRKELHQSVDRDSQPDSVATVVEEDALSSAAVEQKTRPLSPETTRDAQMKRETTEIPRKSSAVRWWRRGASMRAMLAGLMALLLVAGGLYFYRQRANSLWARRAVPRIEELAQAQKYFEAYELAVEARKYLPDDPTITRLMPIIADELTVLTEPAGARVYLKPFAPDSRGQFPARRLIGQTPLSHRQIARGDYILYIEKEGYAGLERTISGSQIRVLASTFVTPAPVRLEEKLVEADRVPARMTLVRGGPYRLVSWYRPTTERVTLDDFFIDKYEVSNQEYKEFIQAGGYRDPKFWRSEFVKDGKTIAWEEAMREFKDRTGLQGPRDWSNQDFPEGKAQYPVTGISWYEAAAYAAFRGKQLPTMFQWEKAARNGVYSPFGMSLPWGVSGSGQTVEHRANFGGGGPMPVESMEFGMSAYGTYHMAGNVAEWCLNEKGKSFLASGGAWGDNIYAFGFWGSYPGFYHSNKLGFRCVLNSAGASGDQGAMPVKVEEDIPAYKVSSEAEFRQWANAYAYDKRVPLDAQVVEVKETDEWRREKISFVGAGGERTLAYLYLPKNYPRPLQVVHYMPPGDVTEGGRTLEESMEIGLTLSLVKSGRAFFGVVLKGYMERKYPPSFVPPRPDKVEYRDQVVNWITDLRRGLDYLETRDDIDAGKVAVFGPSGGAYHGIILLAVEPRYRSIFFTGAGVRKFEQQFVPETSRINFAPHIRAPKLMIQGRYDEAHPLKTEAEPLFKLFREPKRLAIYEGGHIPSLETAVPIMNAWLDETQGPTKK